MPARTSNRSRRFALPSLRDERAERSIEAFVQGRRGPKPSPPAHPRPGDAVALRSMPGRIAWSEAMQREDTRSARYGRPAAVAVFELRPLRQSPTIDSWLRLHSSPVGETLLRHSRATDVVARVTATRFQVLLPETAGDAANRFVERVVGECQERLREIGAPLQLRASVAASTAELPLRDALAKAVRAIEAA